MGMPFDNVMAYNRSDVLNKVLFLKEKRLLLAFGTADGLKLKLIRLLLIECLLI